MLTITIPGEEEFWDAENEVFLTMNDTVVHLEHSLVSLSKWEAIYEKPFLSEDEKTTEEVLAYVKCMILEDDIAPEVFARLDNENMLKINQYIDSKQTATWFPEERQGPKSREKITAELIYYWMINYQIPWEAERWHLQRLFTLIRVCNVKSSTPKKRSAKEIGQERARLNAERMAKLGTTG